MKDIKFFLKKKKTNSEKRVRGGYQNLPEGKKQNYLSI